MEALDLARWQFGITTVYHFLFVPLTIGLAFIVAGFQTAWHRTDDLRYLRLTKFFGKLFLINFAMGVVTGIVQEFQFGMNWSDYSRFVGDIFGAPLAIEGLLAFFLESTFLGLWIFGWGRLPKRVHLATIWAAAIGTLLSAYFILAANSFMQNPVGFRFNPESGRAELTDFFALLTNPVVLVTFPHTIFAAFLTAGSLVLGISIWHLVRRPGSGTPAFRTAARAGAWIMLVSGALVALTGDQQAKVMTDVQPMKMAAAEALWETTSDASFSVFTIGSLDGSSEVFSVRIPGLLSYLSEGNFSAEVEGIDNLEARYTEQYSPMLATMYDLRFGPGDYRPNVAVTYWTFRLMIGVGLAGTVVAAWALWAMRGGRSLPRVRFVVPLAVALPVMPMLGNTFGWIFTEMGRQPWVVFGLMPTEMAVSPGVSAGEVLFTLIGFTLLYGVLAVVEVKLLLWAIRGGLPHVSDELPPHVEDPTDDGDRQLAFAY